MILKSVITSPARWIVNIISIQEKKEYNFYSILLFSMFVGLARYFLEIMLGHAVPTEMNVSVINFIIFYLHLIFLYAVLLKLFIPWQDWQKSINLVLIGIFLGIFPPVIDLFVSGLGSFSYAYNKNFPDEWNFFLLSANWPIGETIILYSTMFFLSIVVYIKTKNFYKTIISFVLSYCVIIFYADITPTLAHNFKAIFKFKMNNLDFIEKYSNLNLLLGRGFSYVFLVTLFELLITVNIYLILNPFIAKNIFKRLCHALPFGMCALFGYSIIGPIDRFAIFISLIIIFECIVALIQNDYFDRVEDVSAGRTAYAGMNDVAFFNSINILFILLLIFEGFIIGYILLLFTTVSFLYSCDFYRAKKYFPANYKIEGVWGISSYIAGVLMGFTTRTGISGNFVNFLNIASLKDTTPYIKALTKSTWDIYNIITAFLIFGGFSVISVFKDYKDINSDMKAGNQTIYVLLKRKGFDIYKFHKIFFSVVFLLLLVPVIRLFYIETSFIYPVLLILVDVFFIWVIKKEASRKTVEIGLVLISVYILILALANHSIHIISVSN